MYELKIIFPQWSTKYGFIPVIEKTYTTLDEAYNASYNIKKVLDVNVKVSIKPVKDTDTLKHKILSDFFKGDKR